MTHDYNSLQYYQNCIIIAVLTIFIDYVGRAFSKNTQFIPLV